MSISTNFKLLNDKHKKYLTAKNGTPKERQNWEDEWGLLETHPGQDMEIEEHVFVEELDTEYGSWLIDLTKIPKDATHILIERF